jgi:serine/threonine protein phosphatase PrpC
LNCRDKFIIIASDGIFEFISNEEAVKIVEGYWKQNNLKGACMALANEAHLRWTTEEEVIDDITCVIVFLDVK